MWRCSCEFGLTELEGGKELDTIVQRFGCLVPSVCQNGFLTPQMDVRCRASLLKFLYVLCLYSFMYMWSWLAPLVVLAGPTCTYVSREAVI